MALRHGGHRKTRWREARAQRPAPPSTASRPPPVPGGSPCALLGPVLFLLTGTGDRSPSVPTELSRPGHPLHDSPLSGPFSSHTCVLIPRRGPCPPLAVSAPTSPSWRGGSGVSASLPDPAHQQSPGPLALLAAQPGTQCHRSRDGRRAALCCHLMTGTLGGRGWGLRASTPPPPPPIAENCQSKNLKSEIF